MSTLRELLRDYLAMRRSLGFKLHSEGVGLLSFVTFMEQVQADFISTDLALVWAKQPAMAKPIWWSHRLTFVRVFARYCHAFDQRTEVPPSALLPCCHRRPTPYFFSDEEIDLLLKDALQLPMKEGFVNQTLYCLFGLLAVSGLRIGEALALTLSDVDLDQGILTILSAKFGKSRLVPLHTTTVQIFADYREYREQFLAGHQCSHWFINAQGKRLNYDYVHRVFLRLTAHLPNQSGRLRPRLHDLRHRFALITVLHWYHDGVDVEQRLPTLSAFLGHVQVSDTYWYLSACPELLEAAKNRLECYWEQRT
jgi:integrase/recombinase XerD